MSRLATFPRDRFYVARATTAHALCFQRRDLFMRSARYWEGRGHDLNVINYVNMARAWHFRGLSAKVQARNI